MNLNELSLTEVSAGLKEKKWSSAEVTRACLEVAKKNAATTHAYVLIDEEGAMKAARASDDRRSRGAGLSEIDGVPVAVKDNMQVQGLGCTAGSNILKNYVSPYDATVTRKLKERGAVILGKTNMDEFAMGSSSETSCHGPTRNPHDLERIPGGSSGGSAVAVAENSAIAAFGSDTGGSIRQPAAMCGVIGLKPTYGRVSRYGLMAMASSLDQIGPFAKRVDDAALLLSAIEGQDPMDSTSLALPDEARLPKNIPENLKGVRVGIPKEYFVAGMEEGVERAVRKAIAKLGSLGAKIKEVSLPHAEYALAVYYVLMPSEVSANLSRYDGVRYGVRVEGADLEQTYRASRGQGFGREVRRRIMLGAYALSAGYYDAYYLQAQKVRRLISNDFLAAWNEVDCIVTPTSPNVAWKLGAKMDDPMSMYLADIFTVPVNVAGVPAVSVPCGRSEGLPVGLQIIGKHFDEKTILNVARAYEYSMEGSSVKG